MLIILDRRRWIELTYEIDHLEEIISQTYPLSSSPVKQFKKKTGIFGHGIVPKPPWPSQPTAKHGNDIHHDIDGVGDETQRFNWFVKLGHL